MLLREYVDVKVGSRSIKKYRDLGYEFEKCGDVISVKVEDAPFNSRAVLLVQCDYCGEIFETTVFCYKTSIKIINKNACNNSECKAKKTKETTMLKYGVDNVAKLSEVQEKMRNTNIEKYGVTNVCQNFDIKAKRDATMLERYGVTIPAKNKDILEKIHQTNIERYGVATPMESKELKENYKNSMKDRYGVEWVGQSPEHRIKQEQTCLKKYGVSNPASSVEIREKIKNTNIKKYGADNPLKNADIKEKQMYSLYSNGTAPCSAQQKYLHLLFGGELNNVIGRHFFADICLLDEKLVIEYDGGGHNLRVTLGQLTQEEFDKKELIRDRVIKSEGYKIIRISSNTDKLPSDSILLQMLQDARNYFSKYSNHSWIEFNIDNSTFRNAENLKGSPYDFGFLRTIKDGDLNTI